MSALMIATIAVKDPEKFQMYLSETQKVAAPYGAKLLMRGKVDQVLTGQAVNHGLVVAVEFPSLEKIEEWNASDSYRQLVPLREEAADIIMTSYQVMP